MPLFRRRQAAEPLAFTVGVDGHQVIVGGDTAGCSLLGDFEGYVGVIARRMPVRADGRDSIAVQNAKMDYVEMTDAAVLIVTLALEDLEAEGVLSSEDVPRKPSFPPLDRELSTYDYIQETYRRAERRIDWLRAVDELFRDRHIAIERPAP